jgi:tetratricopeptide (TPR) repeat protein
MLKPLLIAFFSLFYCLMAFCQTDTTVSFNYFQKGYKKQVLRDYSGALSDYDSCVATNPDYDKVYFYRGLVKYHLDDIKGSIDEYSKFLLANPKSSIAYDNRGYSKFVLSDNQGALADYDS